MSNGVKEHREAYNCNILTGEKRVLRATPQSIARHRNCIKKNSNSSQPSPINLTQSQLESLQTMHLLTCLFFYWVNVLLDYSRNIIIFNCLVCVYFQVMSLMLHKHNQHGKQG